jgi:glycosyltransferase involved in cell wall biosynthesis
MPPVTTIVATRNRPVLLREALDAIVGQEYAGPIEVIVVFDRSEPDRSLERQDADRTIRVVTNTRAPGLAGARNTGIGEATGDYLAFCDDDDAWLPAKLAAQIELMEAEPSVGLAVTGLEILYEGRTIVRTLDRERITFDDLLADRVMEAHPSTVVLRRELAAELGPVDESLPGGYYEDYEYLLRAARVTEIGSVNRPLVRILWGGTSYYTGKFEMIEQAVSHLIDRYPAFGGVPAGKGRLLGQIAFAQAGQGKRGDAVRTSFDALRLDPKQPRAYLAILAASGAVSADRILTALNRRGRGI